MWTTLTQTNRDLVIARLNALVSYEAEHGLKERMRETGLSKPGFFALFKRWRNERSVASLLPRVGGITRSDPLDGISDALLSTIRTVVRRDGARPVSDLLAGVMAAAGASDGLGIDRKALDRAVRAIQLDTIVSDLLAAHPDWTKYRIVEETRSRLHEPPAASTVRRVVERLRAAPPEESDGDAVGLGSRIVIASCPTVRRASRSTESEVWAHVGLVVDVATRTILGGSASQRAFDAMLSAASFAAEFCDGLTAIASGHTRPIFEVHIPDDADANELMRQAGSVGQVANWEQAGEPTDRTTPSVLVKLIGRKLGVLDLRPRGAWATAEQQPQVVAELLARHLRKSRKSPADLPPASVPPATLVAALNAFAGH